MILLIAVIIFIVCLSGLCSEHEDRAYTNALQHFDLICAIEDSAERNTASAERRTETKETDRRIAKDENGREVCLEHTTERIEVN